MPWLCELCANKRKKKRNTLIISENLLKASDSITPTAKTPQVNPFFIPKEKVTLDLIYEELKKINSRRDDIELSINNIKKTLYDYKTIVDSIIQENIDLRNENTVLN